ncbi:MAG: hypothetical protein IJK18_02610 [Clostridia bacterium]|nr:hypothetical protein [Clostridia bacterium]
MFENYIDKIIQLNRFEKEDILNKKFLLEKDEKINIYYAPHNEFVNKKAKIFVIGITPGWTQTQIAFKTANEGLVNNIEIIDILKKCKYNSRFSGSMRKNLIDMLDQIGLNKKFKLDSSSELFNEDNNLLHTTSLIKYPVFINGKNYNGHNPDILCNELLLKYIKKYFISEINELQNVVIIPLGKAVEEVLKYLIDNSIINNKYTILFGFPHPSGANGHRKEIFENNKKRLIKKVNSIS